MPKSTVGSAAEASDTFPVVATTGMPPLSRREEANEKYGVTVHQIDKWYPSSKVCKCGYIYKDLSLKERSWECPACGSKNERDLLASQNILRKGISELESMDKSNGRKTEVPYVIIQESHSLQ